MSEFRKLVKEAMSATPVTQPVAPTYPEWSLAHAMVNHAIIETAIPIEHPTLGRGVVVESSPTSATVRWDRLGSWVKSPKQIALSEASSIIVLGSPKYSHKNGLSEGTNMKKIDMTGAEYLALMESDGAFAAPAPSQTILTKQSNFKSDAAAKPLSSLDGDGGANPEPREEGGSPSDSPKTPPVASMDDPSRKARIGSGAAGAPNRNSNSSSKPSGDSKSASGDSKPSGDSKKSSGKPWEKADKGEDKDTDSEDSEMKKKNESFTFEDADMEGIMGGGDMGGDMTMEHDMGAGEIAVTKAFLVKLLQGVVAASLSDEHFDTIADAIADCCAEDRTLDVADIGEVMSTLKGMAGGQQGGQQDGQQGDQMDGDQDDQFDDGQQGDQDEEPLFGDDDLDECDDEKTMEGKLPDALKKHMKGKAKVGQQDDDKEEVKESRRAVRKPAGKAAPARKKLDEAWMGTIPGMSNGSKTKRLATMSDEDFEIAELKRLSGMR